MDDWILPIHKSKDEKHGCECGGGGALIPRHDPSNRLYKVEEVVSSMERIHFQQLICASYWKCARTATKAGFQAARWSSKYQNVLISKTKEELSTVYLEQGCAAHFRFRSKGGKCKRKPFRLEAKKKFRQNRRTLLETCGRNSFLVCFENICALGISIKYYFFIYVQYLYC